LKARRNWQTRKSAKRVAKSVLVRQRQEQIGGAISRERMTGGVAAPKGEKQVWREHITEKREV